MMDERIKDIDKQILQLAFGRVIRKRRTLDGDNREELAFNVDIDTSYLGQIERGEKEVGLFILTKLIKYFKINPQEITNEYNQIINDKKDPHNNSNP